MKSTEYKLFLDMDGVLVDYASGYRKNFVGSPNSTKEEFYYQSKVAFWAKMDWIVGGKELYQAAKDLFEGVYILSSSGTQDPLKGKIADEGKRLWIKKNMPDMSMDRVFIVPGKERKPDYASKTSILVDDMPITIKLWNAAGGYGILHKANHYKNTIEELEDISRPIKLSELVKRFRR